MGFFFFPAKVEKYDSKIQTGIEQCTKKHLKHKSQKEREGKKGKTLREKERKRKVTVSMRNPLRKWLPATQ